MKINEFDWDRNNVVHIARHGVDAEEVVEVIFNKPIYLKTKLKRYIALGITKAGRYLFVVMKIKGKDKVRVITARDMTKKEKQYFQKRR